MLNPKDYGAVFNGTTDDTTAWQACITAARSQNQTSIYFPRGTSLIKQTLDVSGLGIVGDSSIASKLIAGTPFIGTSMLLLSDGTSGGAGRATYSNFWLYGNRPAPGPTVDGLKIDGNCIGNHFRDLFFSELKGRGVLLDGGLGRVPELTIFDNVYVNGCDGNGWEIRAGLNLVFRACVSEVTLGRAWNITSASQPVSRCIFDACWNEVSGSSAGPVTAFYMEAADAVTVTRHLTNGYGSSPPSTGHGMHLKDCKRCVIDSPDISAPQASTPTSLKIKIEGGTRNRLQGLPGNIIGGDIDVSTAGDTIIESNNIAIHSKDPIHCSNAHAAIATGATRYIQPGTGYDAASDAEVAMPAPGHMSVCEMFAKSFTNPAGGSQTYSVTLMKNGVATPITVLISPSNYVTGVSEDTQEVYLNQGDTYSIRVVSSNAAAQLSRGALHVTIGIRF